MKESDIIEKVRKLLRLAQSANQHEAGLAMEAALRLAAKYKLDVAGLDLDPEIDEVLHRRFRVGERLTYIHKLTLNVVVAFYHVEIVVSRPDAVFVGTATDVAIAHYVHGFLSATCLQALREFETSKKRRPSLTRRRNFCAGFVWGVRRQLGEARAAVELEDSKFALVVAGEKNRREEYMAQLHPDSTTKPLAERKTRRHWTAAMAGFQHGQQTSIRTPLTGGRSILQLPLLPSNDSQVVR